MIFDRQIARKPDHYPWARQMIDAMWAGHWTPNEFSFQSDLHDFKVNMTETECGVVSRVLSTISQVEAPVKQFWARLGDHLPHPSLIDLGMTMANIEVIHSYAYGKLLDVLGLQEVYEDNLKLDVIKGRLAYLTKHNAHFSPDERAQYAYSIILFSLFVENVSLFSQFYIILWLSRYRNVLKDTSSQVNYTRAEETIHALSGARTIQDMQREHPELFGPELRARVLHEAQEAFVAESRIVDWMLGDYRGDGLSPAILKEYIKSRINDSLSMIGYPVVFKVDAALLDQTRWMDEEVLGNSMADFFHRRSTDYVKSHTAIDEDSLFATA